MDDTLRTKSLKICTLLDDQGAGDVVALDVALICSWTSCLIVATVNSRIHMRGLIAHLVPAMRGLDLDCIGSARYVEESNWQLIDGKEIVISLMQSEARDFYQLEELWYQADVIYKDGLSDSGKAGSS